MMGGIGWFPVAGVADAEVGGLEAKMAATPPAARMMMDGLLRPFTTRKATSATASAAIAASGTQARAPTSSRRCRNPTG